MILTTWIGSQHLVRRSCLGGAGGPAPCRPFSPPRWMHPETKKLSAPGLHAVFRIRIHWIRIQIRTQQAEYQSWSGSDPDPIQIQIRTKSGSRVLMTKTWNKNYNWKKNYFFFIRTTIYQSLGLHKTSQVKEEAFSSQREHPALLCRWFRFAQLAKGKKFRP